MKKLIFIICATACCAIFANWHSWETPPKKDQLYMFVDLVPGEQPQDRQILIITHYNNRMPLCLHSSDGWWDARSCDMRRWFSEGSKIIYCPSGINKNFTKRIEGMLASKEIKK